LQSHSQFDLWPALRRCPHLSELANSNHYRAPARLVIGDGTVSGNVGDHQVATGANGNAVAVWREFDGNRFNVRASYYEVGRGWGASNFIDSGDLGIALEPQVAMGADGNTIAVWAKSDGATSHHRIYANHYTVGTGWGAPILIKTNANSRGYSPQIAVDANGNAVAVWSEQRGATTGSTLCAVVVGVCQFA